jgi:hypothetical protein
MLLSPFFLPPFFFPIPLLPLFLSPFLLPFLHVKTVRQFPFFRPFRMSVSFPPLSYIPFTYISFFPCIVIYISLLPLSSITSFFLSFMPFLPLYPSLFLPFPSFVRHSSSFTSKHFLCPVLAFVYLFPTLFPSPVFFSLPLVFRPISSPRILATAEDG